ncbi:MAG: hypothetical protein NTU63_00255 [Candidatus Pacearchaeota archaeon]|nr:hypothetical protein [Candidatus Pacearchaeota archaeon]
MQKSSLISKLKKSLIKTASLALLLSSISFASCGNVYFSKISGQLQDNETDSERQGTVKVYDSSNKKLLKEIMTDSNGEFNVSLGWFYQKLILQARAIKEGESTSYVRTIEISPADAQDLTVRVVPYEDLLKKKIRLEEFVDFAQEAIGGWIRKWNLNNIEGVEIIYKNPFDGTVITKAQQDFIEKKYLDSENIGFFFEGRKIRIQKDDASTKQSEKHYSWKPTSIRERTFDMIKDIIPDKNWIVIAGFKRIILSNIDGNPAGVGLSMVDKDSYINAGMIYLRGIIGAGLLSHESEHTILGVFHSKILPPELTLMCLPIKLDKPGFADKKLAKIVNETTYMPREKIEDILGMDFYSE